MTVHARAMKFVALLSSHPCLDCVCVCVCGERGRERERKRGREREGEREKKHDSQSRVLGLVSVRESARALTTMR